MDNTNASIDIDFLFEYSRKISISTNNHVLKIILIIIIVIINIIITVVITIIVIMILIIHMKKLFSSDWLRKMQFSGNSIQKRVDSVQRSNKPDILMGQSSKKLSDSQSNASLECRNIRIR